MWIILSPLVSKWVSKQNQHKQILQSAGWVGGFKILLVHNQQRNLVKIVLFSTLRLHIHAHIWYYNGTGCLGKFATVMILNNFLSVSRIKLPFGVLVDKALGKWMKLSWAKSDWNWPDSESISEESIFHWLLFQYTKQFVETMVALQSSD